MTVLTFEQLHGLIQSDHVFDKVIHFNRDYRRSDQPLFFLINFMTFDEPIFDKVVSPQIYKENDLNILEQKSLFNRPSQNSNPEL